MKKSVTLNLIISIFFITIASAYTRVYGSYNSFSPTGFFSNIDNSMIFLAIIFLIIFWALNKAILNSILGQHDAVRVTLSLGISLFTIWWIIKSNIEIDTFAINLGISNYLPYILLVFAAIIIWKWGMGILFIFTGLIFVIISYFDLIYQKGVGITLGFALMLLGLWLKRRRKRRLELKGMTEYERMGFKERRLKLKEMKRRDRKNRIEGWGEKGRMLGTAYGKTYYGTKKAMKWAANKIPEKKFSFSNGMRRGGEKSTRSRFVSKASTERYASMFGNRAARKRFKK